MLSTGFETRVRDIDGLPALWDQTLGDPEICIAVLDGPVDQSHPCFLGADITVMPALASATPGAGPMTMHGTHVASEIFGQQSGLIEGVAPRCRGLIVPVFPDDRSRLTQLDLARAIEIAVENGAHVINVSGGERAPTGEAEQLLEHAVRTCEAAGVLITAAAGNDGCECLHVPAAVGPVLAIGALGRDGGPLEISNWGHAYQSHGLLAPGEKIRGALVGGGAALRTGTSFAAPIVAGVAALLLSIQRLNGKKPDPLAVRDALIASALPCDAAQTGQCLAGVLNIPGAYALIATEKKPMMAMTRSETASDLPAMVEPSAPPAETAEDIALRKLAAAGERMLGVSATEVAVEPGGFLISEAVPPPVTSSGVEASAGCGCSDSKSFVFAIGTIGYDFGSEARRDSFRQLMPLANDRPANPYATEQMVHYLGTNGAEATKLIWTFNLELTPIYAIEAELPYAREVYDFLRRALEGQIQKEDSGEYISRVSMSGVLSGRSVRLYSGQVVPIVVVQYRGLWSWNVKTLVDAVLSKFDAKTRDRVRVSLENFLNRVYYELRNLGQTSPDRALNFAATNAFQATDAISRALSPRELVGSTGLYMLADMSVVKSPFCRMDSDCWDVKLTFFDPENDRRARTVLRFTIDVSDELPVTMGPIRSWAEASH